jgi:uncharacterized protein with GYD domain
MSWYMSQFSYTREAWSVLAKNPADRSQELRALTEKLGGKMHLFCYCFGEFDGLTIYEAPDGKAVAAALIAVIGAGHLAKVLTTALLTVEEMMGAMKVAGAVTYTSPKA